MTDDVNKLLVLVEANTRSYERAMKKLGDITTAAGKKSSSGFDPVKKALKDIETGTGRAGKSVERMQRDIAAAAQKTVTPFKLNRMQLQNMSFQINDLAQGLATGQQSPFTLIAQQGSQIAQIFGSGTGVVSALKATGGAIASFITNPINLAVIGIAAATVAVPALWGVFAGSGAQTAQDRLTEIDDLLSRIAKTNQNAADAAQRFIDKQVSAASLMADTNAELLSTQKSLATEIEKVGILAFGLSESFLAPILPVSELREEIRSLGDDLTKENITVEEFRDKLAEIALNPEAPDSIVDLANELRAASQDAADLEAAILGIGAASKSLSNVVDINTNRFGGGKTKDEINAELNRGILSARRDRGIDTKKPRKPRKSQGQKDAEKRAREIAREQEAIEELVRTLEQEIGLVGASDLARQKANATRNLGASATDQQREQIEQLTETLYNEQEAWQQAQAAQDFFANAAANSLTGLIDGTLSAEDAVKQLTASIAQAALQALLLGQGPLAGILGFGGGGGLLSGILGGVFGRAGGGAAGASMPIMVGERGPELFVPNTAGKVVANQNVKGMGQNYSPVYNIDARGADAGAVARLEKGLMERDRRFGKEVQGVNNVSQLRNVRA